MNGIGRRAFNTGVLATAAASIIGSKRSTAATFTTEDITCFCGFGPGTGADKTVRFFTAQMEPLLGVKIKVENVEDGYQGLEGVAATQKLVNSKPDGRTMFITPGAILAANQYILRNPPFNVATALRSFGSIQRPPNTCIVAANSPYKTLAELTEAMKKKDGTVKYGVPNGSVVRVVAALYRVFSGIPTTETVYHASTEVVRDLKAGLIEFGFSNNVYSVDQERAGNVRILAVSLPERLKTAPQYATFAEYGYKIDVDGWWAGFVPSGTPDAIVAELGKAISVAAASEETKKFLAQTIADPLIETPEQSQAQFLQQVEAWRKNVEIAKVEKQG